MFTFREREKIKNFYRAAKSVTAAANLFKIPQKVILRILKSKKQCDYCLKFYKTTFCDKLKSGRYCLKCMDEGKMNIVNG